MRTRESTRKLTFGCLGAVSAIHSRTRSVTTPKLRSCTWSAMITPSISPSTAADALDTSALQRVGEGRAVLDVDALQLAFDAVLAEHRLGVARGEAVLRARSAARVVRADRAQRRL